MNSTPRMARVTKFRGASREAAMPPAKSRWLRITPPKIVPRALVSRGNMLTRSVGSGESLMLLIDVCGGVAMRRRRSRCYRLKRGKPFLVTAVFSFDNIEEGSLQILGDRTTPAAPDLPIVHFANRRQLGGGAGEKSLIGDVQLVAGKSLLD